MTNDQIRAEVRAWLAQNWHNDIPARASSFGRDPRGPWLAKVLEARWAVPRWPEAWYGRGFTDEQAQIVEAEFKTVGAPGAGQDRTNLWANTALKFATESFKKEIIPKLLTGAVGMCLLYSEPGAGSDLAAVRTRAERRGDEFVVTGQKVWTSGAQIADYGMLLARTDWDVPKHKGLSFFFLPMKQQGIEVRPLHQITGESHFNEVFIDSAVVPAANLLGPLNGGWMVLQTALAYERSVMGDTSRGTRFSGETASTQNPLVELARTMGKLDDSAFRQRIAQVAAYRMLNRLNTSRGKAELGQGTSSPIMSLGKLAMSRILHQEASLKLDLLGAEGLLEGEKNPRADEANFLALDAYFTSIGGGTDQIQRNIIAERLLGLPKEPEVDRDIAFREVRAG